MSDDDSRFWIDANPEVKPFRESYAIVDEKWGGVVLYTCDLGIANMLVRELGQRISGSDSSAGLVSRARSYANGYVDSMKRGDIRAGNEYLTRLLEMLCDG